MRIISIINDITHDFHNRGKGILIIIYLTCRQRLASWQKVFKL